jgi:hypothetical protein
MAIELVPLCTVHVQLKLPIEVRTGCAGTRVTLTVSSRHRALRTRCTEPEIVAYADRLRALGRLV